MIGGEKLRQEREESPLQRTQSLGEITTSSDEEDHHAGHGREREEAVADGSVNVNDVDAGVEGAKMKEAARPKATSVSPSADRDQEVDGRAAKGGVGQQTSCAVFASQKNDGDRSPAAAVPEAASGLQAADPSARKNTSAESHELEQPKHRPSSQSSGASLEILGETKPDSVDALSSKKPPLLPPQVQQQDETVGQVDSAGRL
ncbi:unnamed protein product, partial [Amoebophrya sp. A120]|eukprot:GSA120T00025552001.1